MFWGRDVYPIRYIKAPPVFTVGQPKPETVPADIAAAIEAFDNAVRETHEDDRRARAALDAVILKHLRGEA